MKLQHAFEVPASPAETLALLLDAERVVPCMPGATLTEVVDERTWKATITVKLGPVALNFLNEIRVVEMDEAAGTVRLGVKGRDTRGKGGADATVDTLLAPLASGSGTRVQMDTDLRFSGQAAQLGRPGVVKDVSSKLVDQFAGCIRSQLEAGPADEPAADEGDGDGTGSSEGPSAASPNGAPRPHRPPPPPASAPAAISGFSILATTVKGQLSRLAKPLAAAGVALVALVAVRRRRRR